MVLVIKKQNNKPYTFLFALRAGPSLGGRDEQGLGPGPSALCLHLEPFSKSGKIGFCPWPRKS